MGVSVWRMLLALPLLCGLAAADPAQAEAAKKKKQSASIEANQWEGQRSVFSGNEMRMGAFGTMNADCSSGPIVDIRISKPPANGTLTFEEMRNVAEFRKDDLRSRCNGTSYDAVRLVYQSKDDFTGKDRVTIDVDFKNGNIRKYTVNINVR